MGSCTRMAVGCAPLTGVAAGGCVAVASAVAEVAGNCTGSSVPQATAAISRRAASMKCRIADSSRFHRLATFARPLEEHYLLIRYTPH